MTDITFASPPPEWRSHGSLSAGGDFHNHPAADVAAPADLVTAAGDQVANGGYHQNGGSNNTDNNYLALSLEVRNK